MKTEEFYKLVQKMRTSQNLYFRTRSSEALRQSKHLERLVDAAVDNYLNPSFFSSTE